MSKVTILVLLLALTPVGAEGQMRYGVKATVDEHADFARLKTYMWQPGWTSWDPAIDKQIVTAVDRELGALGFTKRTDGASDVTVSYAALLRTDTNLKAKGQKTGKYRKTYPTYPVGSLLVVMRDPRTQEELFRGRSVTPLTAAPDALQATIDHQVARIFAKYPTRQHD